MEASWALSVCLVMRHVGDDNNHWERKHTSSSESPPGLVAAAGWSWTRWGRDTLALVLTHPVGYQTSCLLELFLRGPASTHLHPSGDTDQGETHTLFWFKGEVHDSEFCREVELMCWSNGSRHLSRSFVNDSEVCVCFLSGQIQTTCPRPVMMICSCNDTLPVCYSPHPVYQPIADRSKSSTSSSVWSPLVA